MQFQKSYFKAKLLFYYCFLLRNRLINVWICEISQSVRYTDDAFIDFRDGALFFNLCSQLRFF